MMEKTEPLITKATGRISGSSEGFIVLQVETENFEANLLRFSLDAAIQACALLLGDSRIAEAIPSDGKIVFSERGGKRHD